MTEKWSIGKPTTDPSDDAHVTVVREDGSFVCHLDFGYGKTDNQTKAALITLAPELAEFILDMAAEGSPHSERCGCAQCEFYREAKRLAARLIPDEQG